MELHRQQCLNHNQREAVARCPQCRQFYCRECITEHDDRVICAACLRKTVRPEQARRRAFAGLARAAVLSLGLLTAWLAFYWTGRILLSIPVEVHDATIWKTPFMQE